MLTVKQKRCLDWITDFIEQQGLSPSFEDIRVGLNYRSKDPVRSLLNALGNKGYIKRERYKARSIQVLQPPVADAAKPGRSLKTVPDPVQAVSAVQPDLAIQPEKVVPISSASRLKSKSGVFRGIPLLGGIAAHSPKTTFMDEPEIYLPLEIFPSLARRSPYDLAQLFALRVQGDSMIESHILDGDVILLRRNPDLSGVKNGAIVAARVGDAATLKHYIRSDTTVTLQPANSAYQPTVFNVEDVDVQGVYTGILVRGVV